MTRILLMAVLFAAWSASPAGFAGELDVHHKGATRSDRVIIINRDITLLDAARGAEEGVPYEAASVKNGIDTFTFKKMKEDGVPVNATCDDGSFIRRLSLVLTGRLPEPARTRTFLASNDPGKRAALIDEMLASEAFNTYWSFWFQEFFQSTASQLRGGHKLYNAYFAEAVADGKHLDTLARELMSGTGLTDEVAEANFYARASNGARFPLDFMDNAAIAVSTKFLGVPLECISCHDGAHHLEGINLYLAEKKRADLWGMAAFFSELGQRPGNRVDNLVISVNITKQTSRGYNAVSDRGDRPDRNGGLIAPNYLFDGSGVTNDRSFLDNIVERVVGDRQFARNFANLLWGHAFGLAMVEPTDGFDFYRIDPEYPLPEGWQSQVLDYGLLEHMTDRLIDVDFDLRAYLRYILNSATFQMSSEWPAGGWQETYAPYYSRYLARHMTAESVYDSIAVATGVAPDITYNYFNERGIRHTAKYAHELPDVTQPRGDRNSGVATFLDSFGRGNRYDQPRNNSGSIVQALLLMNAPLVDNAINTTGSRVNGYLNAGMSMAQIIDEVYLDAYSRLPSDKERDQVNAELANYNGDRAKVATLVWLLLNKVEFTFIY